MGTGGASAAARAQAKALEEQTAKAEKRARDAAEQTVKAQAIALERDAAIQENKTKQEQQVSPPAEIDLNNSYDNTLRKRRQKYSVTPVSPVGGVTSQVQI